MKIYLKKLLNKNNLIFIVIIVIALILRFYNFSDRVVFWSEQARSLVVSGNYINEKFSLLGQEYFRVDSNSHRLFSGAVFNYSLVPLLLITNYDPILITGFFALLNVFTGIVIYLVVKKVFDSKLALLSMFFFLFNSFMIYHSLFIWNYNYLPIVGICIVYLLWSYFKDRSFRKTFLLGVLSGLGVSIQYLFIPFGIMVFLAIFFRSKNKLKDIVAFVLGTSLGNLPMVLFDLRHNFYHLRTLWQYALDTINGISDAGFSYYYLLPLWPVFSIFGAYLLYGILKLKTVLIMVVVIIYLYFNLTSSKVSFVSPLGMPEGLVVRDVGKASQIITSDINGDFNVAEVLDFDKRAYVLRYYLIFKYGKKPLSEIDYENDNTLYVLAQNNYNFEKSNVWEITAGGNRKVELLENVGQGYGVYKLTK